MEYHPLGRTGLKVSAVAFGAGPVSGLLTGGSAEQQLATVAESVRQGINWFDTAATYGNGESERSLGAALARIESEQELHIATKVRVHLSADQDLRPVVLDSVRESLIRLQRPKVTLLQVHNSMTRNRNDQPTSITPDDVLGPRGILAGMQEARAAGWVDHFGLTGIGDAASLCEVMRSGAFDAIQAPLHFLNPSALRDLPDKLCDPDYGRFLQTACDLKMGIFAIRIFAAGALLGAEPSAHTLKTPFFPLALYQRDQVRVQRLQEVLGGIDSVRETALRYVLSLPEVTAAIIGFGAEKHVTQCVADATQAPLSTTELNRLEDLRNHVLASH